MSNTHKDRHAGTTVRFGAYILLWALAAFAAWGCKEKPNSGPSGAAPATAPSAGPATAGGVVRAMVAASTQDAVKQIADDFMHETGVEVKISAGGSNLLATQIIEGAPADVFLSASSEWAEALRQKGLVAESRGLLGNALVLVVPQGNPAGVQSPRDLLGAAVAHVALAGEKVPAGAYAEQALKAAGVYDALLTSRKVARGQDVRETLAYVERGEAEAGIVYATDARISPQVQVVYTFDPKTHDEIIYPLVLLKTGDGNAAARRFYEYVASPPAARVFRGRGFIIR